MSADTLPAPIAVWDTRDRDSFFRDTQHPARFMQAVEWAKRHIDRPEDTYRVEFYLIDCPFAIVHRFATNEDGSIRWDLAGREPAIAEPVTVMLSELPPEHLRLSERQDG
jgi:hypothetical protein